MQAPFRYESSMRDFADVIMSIAYAVAYRRKFARAYKNDEILRYIAE